MYIVSKVDKEIEFFFLASPRDKIITHVEAISSCAFPIIYVSC